MFLKEALCVFIGSLIYDCGEQLVIKAVFYLKVEGEKNMLSERPTILVIVLLVCYINVHKCTVFSLQVYCNHVCK